jgi:hypothetical protein
MLIFSHDLGPIQLNREIEKVENDVVYLSIGLNKFFRKD